MNDPKILDQLVALKLHNVSGTEPDNTPPAAWEGAMRALELKDVDLYAIGASRAWTIAWDFAMEAAAIAIDNPISSGDELISVIATMRQRYLEELESETNDREMKREDRLARATRN